MGVILKKKVKSLKITKNDCNSVITPESFFEEGYGEGIKEAQQKASDTVMDLYYALKSIKATPTLGDLVKLAKRIKGIYK